MFLIPKIMLLIQQFFSLHWRTLILISIQLIFFKFLAYTGHKSENWVEIVVSSIYMILYSFAILLDLPLAKIDFVHVCSRRVLTSWGYCTLLFTEGQLWPHICEFRELLSSRNSILILNGLELAPRIEGLKITTLT